MIVPLASEPVLVQMIISAQKVGERDRFLTVLNQGAADCHDAEVPPGATARDNRRACGRPAQHAEKHGQARFFNIIMRALLYQ